MSVNDDRVDDLLNVAERFASELTATIRGSVAPHCAGFKAAASGERISIRQDPDTGIPLCVSGEPLLTLKVTYEAIWDSRGQFLAVHESAVKVYAGPSAAGEPLFRYEFERGKSAGAPKAHIQIHAHRDDLTFVMTRGGRTTSGGQQRAYEIAKGKAPRMWQLHFPVGGDRFRPALEDVLDMLINELGVDCEDGWRDVLSDGRRTWRRVQAAAVVRDDPERAAGVLERMGYVVTPPPDGHPGGNPQRFTDL